jgi:GTP cyclohydrolase IA
MSVDRARAARAVADFLAALGRDVARDPELSGTPERVASAWADELLSGYAVDLRALLAEGSPTSGGDLVLVRGIAVATMCPHHLMPALGEATLAYVPGARLFGLGTLSALVRACARRLVLQEALGAACARALVEQGGAAGAWCRLVLRHTCYSARGEREHAAEVITVAEAGTPLGARVLGALG